MSKIKKFFIRKNIIIILSISATLLVVSLPSYFAFKYYKENLYLKQKIISGQDLSSRIEEELNNLKGQDQLKINLELKKEIEEINKTYQSSVKVYEDLLSLKEKIKDTKELDKLYAEIVSNLAKKDYKGASDKINLLSSKINEQEQKLSVVKIPENVPVNNTPPGSGYQRQQVQTDTGSFMVSIISSDISSTKVIVDTASDSTCANDCPTLPLATYVSRNGAFAGVNGSYFCPAEYPSCSGKTNSFDLLLMNKNKTYFNSDNNVYSSNPGVVFGGGYIRFLSQVSEWGRDTGIDGMISNYPLLISGGNIVFSGDGDQKQSSKGNRSFVANKGSSVYIGVVHSVTVAESAKVLKALGMENALNLDDGGSTALWSGGYKVGPGRNIPNAILFIRK